MMSDGFKHKSQVDRTWASCTNIKHSHSATFKGDITYMILAYAFVNFICQILSWKSVLTVNM